MHDAGALLLVDAVTSLGGVELRIDDWRIDACYSGTQKCLSCPPGLSPMTFSPAAVSAMDRRKAKVQSWYLDLSMLRQYWGELRVYHHTAPINMSYGLHEALRIVLEEGLEARQARHTLNHRARCAGVEAIGMKFIPDRSLTSLNAISIPPGVDDARVSPKVTDGFRHRNWRGPWAIQRQSVANRIDGALQLTSKCDACAGGAGAALGS